MLTRTRTLIFIKISQPVRAPATVKGIGPNPSPLTRFVWQNCPLYSLETPALLWGSSSPDKKLICWTKHVPISGLHFFYFSLAPLPSEQLLGVITITKLELAQMRDHLGLSSPRHGHQEFVENNFSKQRVMRSRWAEDCWIFLSMTLGVKIRPTTSRAATVWRWN